MRILRVLGFRLSTGRQFEQQGKTEHRSGDTKEDVLQQPRVRRHLYKMPDHIIRENQIGKEPCDQQDHSNAKAQPIRSDAERSHRR
jgi:hypothetical protein